MVSEWWHYIDDDWHLDTTDQIVQRSIDVMNGSRVALAQLQQNNRTGIESPQAHVPNTLMTPAIFGELASIRSTLAARRDVSAHLAGTFVPLAGSRLKAEGEVVPIDE